MGNEGGRWLFNNKGIFWRLLFSVWAYLRVCIYMRAYIAISATDIIWVKKPVHKVSHLLSNLVIYSLARHDDACVPKCKVLFSLPRYLSSDKGTVPPAVTSIDSIWRKILPLFNFFYAFRLLAKYNNVCTYLYQVHGTSRMRGKKGLRKNHILLLFPSNLLLKGESESLRINIETKVNDKIFYLCITLLLKQI